MQIKNLNVIYNKSGVHAVNSLSFSLGEGESLGIVGESGSGKSTILFSLMGILKKKTRIEGEILYKGKNLLQCSEKQLSLLRWRDIAIVFQNLPEYLNPGMKIIDQITETFTATPAYETEQRVCELCEQFDLKRKWLNCYPSELSGGMRQRVFLIMALVLRPSVLLVDEPVASLEQINKERVIEYLKQLRRNNPKLRMIVVSHDLECIRQLTDKTLVLFKGCTMEYQKTETLLGNPCHPYTRTLLLSSPQINPYRELSGLKKLTDEESLGCPFFPFCTQRTSTCKIRQCPPLETFGTSCLRGGIISLLSVRHLTRRFGSFTACRNCSLSIRHGEVVSIIGESGSGKSTLCRVIAGVLKKTDGQIIFNPDEFPQTRRMGVFHGVQIVNQDPSDSLNPRFSVEKALLEPLVINRLGNRQFYPERVKEALNSVDLPSLNPDRIIGTLSGGQMKRVSIARALIMKPRLLIADEITAGLDLSASANILSMLKNAQATQGFSMLFVTHDLHTALKISDRIIVMKNSEIIDAGEIRKVCRQANHPYTKALLETLNSKLI